MAEVWKGQLTRIDMSASADHATAELRIETTNPETLLVEREDGLVGVTVRVTIERLEEDDAVQPGRVHLRG